MPSYYTTVVSDRDLIFGIVLRMSKALTMEKSIPGKQDDDSSIGFIDGYCYLTGFGSFLKGPPQGPKG